ncbi:hypothetical protein BH11PSE3_BH11PSE3_49730 [soil metagenome]
MPRSIVAYALRCTAKHHVGLAVLSIMGGMGTLNDPWGDLVTWARALSVVEVEYRLFVETLKRLAGGPFYPRAS